jgi:hypothetical protein
MFISGFLKYCFMDTDRHSKSSYMRYNTRETKEYTNNKKGGGDFEFGNNLLLQ